MESSVLISWNDPILDDHPIEWHRGVGVEPGTWGNAGLTHGSFVKALLLLQDDGGAEPSGTMARTRPACFLLLPRHSLEPYAYRVSLSLLSLYLLR